MITKSKQAWEIGQTVKVGFLSGLVVMTKIATPGDYAPDAYILRRNEQLYKFVPHNGLEKISIDEARDLMAKAKAHAERCASAAVAKASDSARKSSEINNLFA
jgi:hypothetical protein